MRGTIKAIDAGKIMHGTIKTIVGGQAIVQIETGAVVGLPLGNLEHDD